MRDFFNEDDIKCVLDQSVQSTEAMNEYDVHPDIIKARLKLLRELADGFGVEIKVPSNCAIMIKRFMRGEL